MRLGDFLERIEKKLKVKPLILASAAEFENSLKGSFEENGRVVVSKQYPVYFTCRADWLGWVYGSESVEGFGNEKKKNVRG